jgi:hypothetical protein
LITNDKTLADLFDDRNSGVGKYVESLYQQLPEDKAEILRQLDSVYSTYKKTNKYIGDGTNKYDDYFAEASSRYGVSVDVLKAIAQVESEFNPQAKSNAGAYGIMQVIPRYWGKDEKGNAWDLNDPRQQILAGARAISTYLKQNDGDLKTALIQYNTGDTKDIVDYDEKVMGLLKDEVVQYASRQLDKPTFSALSYMQNITDLIGMKNQIQTREIEKRLNEAFNLSVGVAKGISIGAEFLMNAIQSNEIDTSSLLTLASFSTELSSSEYRVRNIFSSSRSFAARSNC